MKNFINKLKCLLFGHEDKFNFDDTKSIYIHCQRCGRKDYLDVPILMPKCKPPAIIRPLKETHMKGIISIENLPDGPLMDDDLGIQIATDGRIWICINGIAFLRFKPSLKIDHNIS